MKEWYWIIYAILLESHLAGAEGRNHEFSLTFQLCHPQLTPIGSLSTTPRGPCHIRTFAFIAPELSLQQLEY